ncbi:MAG: hypothetical protein JNJ83_10470 [Verrucomicrobiaceae bacterium]|nr:hypothetical protein [Verrucomicrobiaceae bacterium]
MNWDEGVWDQGVWDAPGPSVLLPTRKRRINRKAMASNPTPENPDIARALADRMADGCHTHELIIGIKQNTEAVMRAAMLALKNGQLDLGAAKAAVGSTSDALKVVDASITEVLANCRLRLVNQLGKFWGPAWEATGFPDQSTAVPAEQDKRLSLLDSLSSYFTLNPARESADLGATAAACTAAYGQLSDARAAWGNAKTAQATKVNGRDAAFKTLRKRIRGLIEELGTLIAEDDPRWEDFGLTIPANPSAPEGIAGLTGTAAGSGKIHLEWTYATRMTGTRLMTKRTTGPVVDDDFINSGTAEGLEKTLPGFTAGAIVLVKAIPYNEGGDGPASPEVQVNVT